MRGSQDPPLGFFLRSPRSPSSCPPIINHSGKLESADTSIKGRQVYKKWTSLQYRSTMDTSNPPSTSMEEDPTPEYMQKHYQEALQRYTVYEGDSDEYDSEEEQKILDELKPEEKADYDEYKEVFIKQLVHYGRTMPVADEIR